MRELCERVRRRLAERAWTQAHLAHASGLSASVVSRLLAGRRRWSKTHLGRVAAALSTTPDELTRGLDADDVATIDVAFVATLTRDHAFLVSEQTRLTAALAAAEWKLAKAVKAQQVLARQLVDLRLNLDRTRRSLAAAEASRRIAESRERDLARQVSALRVKSHCPTENPL